MKKLTLVTSPSLWLATKTCISQINLTKNNILCEHVIVVPDRFSLQAENLIFDELGLESTINISVVGLSRLASMVLEEANIAVNNLSTQGSILVVRKVILENMKDFTFFQKKSASLGFCDEIFKTIQQLVASKVSYEELVTDKSKILGDKLHDIALVYKAYIGAIKHKFVDSGEKFELFEKAIEKSEFVKSSRFYFCQFDSLTEQGGAIFEKICEYAEEVYAAVVTPNGQKNSFLFTTDFYEKILLLKKMDSVNIITAPVQSNVYKKHIQDNLFVSNCSFLDGKNHFEAKSAISLEEEVFFCVRKIKEHAFLNGTPLNKIAVVVSNLENKKFVIQNIFSENSVPFFIDSSTALSSTALSQLILKMLNIFPLSKKAVELVSFFKSEFFGNDNLCELENFVLKYGIKKNELLTTFKRGLNENNFELIEETRKKISEMIIFIENGIKEADSFKEKTDFLCLFLEKIHAKEMLEKIRLEEIEEKRLYSSRISEQTFDKFQELLTNVSLLFSEEKISWEDFSMILESGMTATKISEVPISTNVVYIGDSEKSFFGDYDIMFVIGASEGDYPNVKIDCGLISDREILALENLKISPTIKMLNSRARFKVFGDLCCASKKIYATFSSGDQGKENLPSSIVVALNKIFSVEKRPLPILTLNEEEYGALVEIEKLASGEQNINELNLPFLACSQKNAEILSLKFESYELPEASLASSILNKLINTHFSIKKSLSKIENAEKLFFGTGTTSVSKISTFLTCPRLFFLTEGLKAKKREDCKVESNDIGTILHKVAERFAKENLASLGKMTNEQTFLCATKMVEEILNMEEFSFFSCSSENAFVVQVIKSEAINLCKAINNEQKNSLFKPTCFEKKFGKGFVFGESEIYLNDKKINVIGTIDRIDELDNLFRIIDYKTGSSKQSLSEIFYGTNIQLMLYAYIAKKALKKNLVGSCIFPISNAFDPEGKKKTNGRLTGFMTDDVEILKKMDTEISELNPKTNFLDISFTSKLKLYPKKTIMSEEKLSCLSDYSWKVFNKAVHDLASGLISCYPIASGKDKLPCRFCYAKSVCPFNEKENSFRSFDEINIEDLERALKNEEENK
ncbi:MAG: PD-(D/E)XK nuclease family protein [Clostridia bacterium]